MPVSGRRLLFYGWVLGVWLAGCSRSYVVPPAPSLPQLLPPVPVGRLDSDVAVAPSFDSQPVPDEVRFQPTQPLRNWKYVVLHHTASTSGSVETIHAAHLQNKDRSGKPWLGIGYHFVIGNGRGMADGEIEPTFRWRQQMSGAHAGISEYNQQGIGIVLVGNFEKGPPSTAQRRSVEQLVNYLCRTLNIKEQHIVGHGDIKATACPGQFFPLEALRSSVAAHDDSGGLPLARYVPATGISRKDALRK